MAIKNFWSLTVDEAIVADKIKNELGKNYEVFFPVNSQLKDIDLVVFNLKNGKSKTIQVKGSRSHYGKNKDDRKNQYSWISVKKDSIFKTTNKTDFFIFVWHIVKNDLKTRKRTMEQDYIIISLEELQEKCKNEKKTDSTGTYRFNFWADLENKEAYDYPSGNPDGFDYSKYLNNFDLLKK